jgi:UDP-2,3-diacylglucosamine hydrolase
VITELRSPCYVVSDHHIGAAPPETEASFLQFLTAIREKAGSLVINGDLLDFWFEWRRVVPRTGFRVLAALADLVRRGTPVLWISGNHDCWGGDVLREDVGVHYMHGTWTGTASGWRTVIEHGDGLRPEKDRPYRALRAVIRHPAAVSAMRLLHPDFGTWLAVRSSATSRDHRARDGGAELRNVALDRLSRPGAPELYILGHNHVAALERAASGGVYGNAGSWGHGGTHLVILEDRIELRAWSSSTGDERLNAIDRRTEKTLADR